MLERLTNYLRSNFNVSQNAITLATKTQAIEPNILPIVLWQYGFLNISQLEQVLDWLEVSN
ncbi:MAG: DUF2949 domain-containing protein [Cyanobacteria bacterium J06607_15]